MENHENINHDTITFETKVQTIYYETSTGKITKFHHVSNDRLNNKEAEEILKQNGINATYMLRVITERVGVKLTREQFENNIDFSERFYKN